MFRRLVESVKDYAIFMLDPQGHIASWNAGAQRLKGYQEEDVIGRHFSIFYPAEAVASNWPQQELERAAELGRFEDEGWRVRKDGSLFWANVVITAVRDDQGGLIGYAKVTRDLTERRQHEQRLKESEESLRLLVEGVRDHAMFLIRPDGSVASWNQGAERLLGFRAQDVIGQRVGMLYTDEDRTAGKPQAELLSARLAGFFAADGWRIKADGSRIWTHSALTALRDINGHPRGYAQIVSDLTSRIEVEALRSEGQRLYQFIAMLSHELRNPLAPISDAVRILKMVDDRKRVDWCADMIGRQTAHLVRLVDDLLDVSRITNGKNEMHFEAMDLCRVVQLAIEAFQPEIARRAQNLHVHLPSEPVMVRGDPVRLTQVVNNLLSNASKYTQEGGRIDVSLDADRSVATFRVTDNGVGMQPSLMIRAFDMFVQGEQDIDRSGGGLGIGLTLVKRIIEMHGGSVAVASAGREQGSTFTVTMPVGEMAGASQAHRAGAAH